MSYEMSNNQGMTYPYPPPAGAPAVTISQKKSGFSKWWPLSFFIVAILLIIIGGALVGAGAGTDCVWDDDCARGMFWGAVVCFVLGGLLKFIAWILLIIWCVKRSTRGTSVAYSYQPLNNFAGQPPAAGPAPPAPLYQNGPYQNAPPYSNAPPYPNAATSYPGAPPQKDASHY
ncbi:hypothetical protein VTH82DRAFT_6253 [Thermothelomyces myriococcoides]